MRVRTRKAAPVHKGAETPKPRSESFTFPAPIRGWVLNESLATPQPGGASVLDNWICTTTGIIARGGKQKYATLDSAVDSMFSYKSGVFENFFAATATNIYDVSSVVDPTVVPTPIITGQTSGYYSTTQFGTPGGEYLYAVNGDDSPQLFDGSTWTAITGVSSPAITGVTTSELSQVWSFANRLFFVRKDTQTCYYLPIDSIGGAASEFSLAGIFKKGGSLLFGATWSLDAGDGLDDKCVFVSTEGEVAVYEGTNPGDAANWRKAGVYQISKPLGKNATTQAGGDLLIATEVGLVPVSESIRRDIGALFLSSVSKNITPYWQDKASELADRPWEIIKWPQKNIMVVSQPGSDTDTGTCLVANLQTGAWSRFTGWATRCMELYADGAYFGSPNGVIYQMNVSGNDDGENYTCSYLGLHDAMGAQGLQKTIKQMRATFQASTPIAPKIGSQADFSTSLSAIPPPAVDNTGSVWGSGTWDVSNWDEAALVESKGRWTAVGKTGRVLAPEVQLTFGNTSAPDVELVSIDAQYSVGAMVA